MKKIVILGLAFLIILTLISIGIIFFSILSSFGQGLTGAVISNTYSYTKAICNKSNYCQDYQIFCEGKKAVSISPITGAVVQFSKNWEDPRDEETRNRICD